MRARGDRRKGGSRRIATALILFTSLAVYVALAGNAKAQDADLVAHEWGTFTSIAGNAGTAVQWFPWAVPSDLPKFVEHFQSSSFKVNLSGTIRMETPVLYFYSPRETRVSVHVSFSKGLITEWYPHVTRYTPSGNVRTIAFNEREADGSVTWDSIMLRPTHESSLVHENEESRYYAARATASTPVLVSSPTGQQQEKFLFYRGVSSESSPVTARMLVNGSVHIENGTGEPLARLFLFERRGDDAGLRTVTSLGETATLEMPILKNSVADTAEAILSVLMEQGLYPDEARAMLETWKDSWFEEGTRLLYVVPASFVNRVLPLSISPAPSELTRVFVGRLELVSIGTRTAIEEALAKGDEATLAKYSRFLEPMLQILLQRESEPLKAQLIRLRLEQPYLLPVLAQAQFP
jgi:hypothetical protein